MAFFSEQKPLFEDMVWRMIKGALYAFVGVVGVVLLVGCDSPILEEMPTHEESSIVKDGDLAPLFVAELIDGGEVSLEEYRGAPMMLILFSHTCPDCKALLDDVQRLYDDNVAMPALLAVGRDATAEELHRYRLENGYEFSMASDSKREIFNLYATTYVPRLYVIDPSGVVVAYRVEYKPHYLAELLEHVGRL